MKMAKFVIGVDEAIVAVRKQFGLPESVQVEIEFYKTAQVKADTDWQDVPKGWTLSSPPGEVDYNDIVEVVFRSGATDDNRAGVFGACWRQDDNPHDIIKYRRV